MKTWLCIGSKNPVIPKCLDADVSIDSVSGVWGNVTQKLVVYCNKKNQYVRKYITMCEYYNNQTLGESINGNRE